MVVDECAIEYDPSVRPQRPGNYVGRVCGVAPIYRRPQLTLGIRLHDHAAEIGNLLVNLVELLLPPLRHFRIERIEGAEPSDLLRHADIHSYAQLHAIWPKHIGDASKLWNKIRVEDVEVGVHVADIAPVDADGSQQSCILHRAR